MNRSKVMKFLIFDPKKLEAHAAHGQFSIHEYEVYVYMNNQANFWHPSTPRSNFLGGEGGWNPPPSGSPREYKGRVS